MNHKLTYSGWGPIKGRGIAWCERCGLYGKDLQKPCVMTSQKHYPIRPAPPIEGKVVT